MARMRDELRQILNMDEPELAPKVSRQGTNDTLRDSRTNRLQSPEALTSATRELEDSVLGKTLSGYDTKNPYLPVEQPARPLYAARQETERMKAPKEPKGHSRSVPRADPTQERLQKILHQEYQFEEPLEGMTESLRRSELSKYQAIKASEGVKTYYMCYTNE